MQNQYYQPEIWEVRKDDIYSSIYALSAAIEYSKELLSKHDIELGRTIHKNKIWAETLEKDIYLMEKSLKNLKQYPISKLKENS